MARPRNREIRANSDEKEEEERKARRAALIQQTLAVWQPRTSRKLTEEDARQILENLVGFFSLLNERDQKDKREAAEVLGKDKKQ